MSQIQTTGIARVQHLNCAKGQAATDSVLQEAHLSTDIMIILIQEPWISNTGKPPTSPLYDLFTPNTKIPKCATYIRKNLKLNPQKQKTHGDSLQITITINNQKIDIFNIYSPGRSRYIADIIHQLKPAPNAYIAGDFNAHHTW